MCRGPQRASASTITMALPDHDLGIVWPLPLKSCRSWLVCCVRCCRLVSSWNGRHHINRHQFVLAGFIRPLRPLQCQSSSAVAGQACRATCCGIWSSTDCVGMRTCDILSRPSFGSFLSSVSLSLLLGATVHPASSISSSCRFHPRGSNSRSTKPFTYRIFCLPQAHSQHVTEGGVNFQQLVSRHTRRQQPRTKHIQERSDGEAAHRVLAFLVSPDEVKFLFKHLRQSEVKRNK